MKVLESAACGGIGPHGMTQDEIDEDHENGGSAGDDAYYDTCQCTWLLLRSVQDDLAEVEKKAKRPGVVRGLFSKVAT